MCRHTRVPLCPATSSARRFHGRGRAGWDPRGAGERPHDAGEAPLFCQVVDVGWIHHTKRSTPRIGQQGKRPPVAKFRSDWRFAVVRGRNALHRNPHVAARSPTPREQSRCPATALQGHREEHGRERRRLSTRQRSAHHSALLSLPRAPWTTEGRRGELRTLPLPSPEASPRARRTAAS
jgi:hypothetical protein